MIVLVSARAELQLIQACLLSNIYGRLMSTFENHELASFGDWLPEFRGLRFCPRHTFTTHPS